MEGDNGRGSDVGGVWAMTTANKLTEALIREHVMGQEGRRAQQKKMGVWKMTAGNVTEEPIAEHRMGQQRNHSRSERKKSGR